MMNEFPPSFISYTDSMQVTHKVMKLKGNESFDYLTSQNPLNDLKAIILWEDSLIEQITFTADKNDFRLIFSAAIPSFDYSIDHFKDKVEYHLKSFMQWFQLDEFELKYTGFDSMNQVKIISRGDNLYQLDFKLSLEIAKWNKKTILEFWQAIDQLNQWVIAHSKTSDLLKKPRPDAGAAPLPVPTPAEPPIKPIKPGKSQKPRAESLTIPFTEIPESPFRYHVKKISQTMVDTRWILLSKKTRGVMYPDAPLDAYNYNFDAFFFIDNHEDAQLIQFKAINQNGTYNLAINHFVGIIGMEANDYMLIEKLSPPFYRLTCHKPDTVTYSNIEKNLMEKKEGMTETDPTQI